VTEQSFVTAFFFSSTIRCYALREGGRSMLDLTAPIEVLGESRDITHIDLYYKGRRASDSTLVTQCVLVDLTAGAEDVDQSLHPELELVRPGRSVILRTGWEQHRGTVTYDQSPSIDRRLIERLVGSGASLLLVDSPGVYGGARGPEHNEIDKYLADHEAYAVENLVNVALIERPTFRLYCVPIYSSERNNAPCRVMADLDATL
jgi:kynurenine formamidase